MLSRLGGLFSGSTLGSNILYNFATRRLPSAPPVGTKRKHVTAKKRGAIKAKLRRRRAAAG